MKEYAYARVSANDQNLERQIDCFRKLGIETKNIYSDKKSGKDFERDSYKKLMRKLRKGDLLVIKSIDRLGRNYKMIIDEWNRIVNVIGANIFVVDMPLLDTRGKSDTLVGKFISDIVLQVLSFVSENERLNIRLRQAEGIRLARARGVRFGRPKIERSPDFMKIISDYKQRIITLSEALDKAEMSRSNFYYHCRHADKIEKEGAAAARLLAVDNAHIEKMD